MEQKSFRFCLFIHTHSPACLLQSSHQPIKNCFRTITSSRSSALIFYDLNYFSCSHQIIVFLHIAFLLRRMISIKLQSKFNIILLVCKIFNDSTDSRNQAIDAPTHRPRSINYKEDIDQVMIFSPVSTLIEHTQILFIIDSRFFGLLVLRFEGSRTNFWDSLVDEFRYIFSFEFLDDLCNLLFLEGFSCSKQDRVYGLECCIQGDVLGY